MIKPNKQMINNFSGINERISYIIDNQANGNKKKFAEMIGFAPQVVSNIVSGRKSKPSFDVLNAIISTFDYINSKWLITGDESPYIDDAIQIHNTNRKTSDSTIEIQEVPLYDLEASAGLVQLFRNKGNILDTIKIPNIPKCDGALPITGDSMYPLLKSGDIALYKEVPVEIQSIFFGEMYLLGIQIDEHEEMVTAKYVQKSELGNDYIKLVSQNQHHQPKDIPLKMVNAMALIKVSIRINTMF